MAAAKANKETIIGVGSGENRKWKMKSMVESLEGYRTMLWIYKDLALQVFTIRSNASQVSLKAKLN